jgi:pyruvate formate lyase activating enzyme
VEKKPFFHVLPGSDALTFGMLGCDFHCSYCQNWVTSQALRDPAAVAPIKVITPDQLVAAALQQRARLIVSSYNEPLITAEWSRAVFEKARPAGLLTAFVSNGNATPEALDFIGPHLNACKIDLKGFDPQRYRTLGGQLEHVLDSIRLVHQGGLWLEVLTLVIPGFNDGEVELRGIARFIAGISRDIPWHVTAFHQDYQMTDPRNTVAEDLMRAAEIGAAEGLHFVYAGNLPGRVGEWENTRCPRCGRTLIERNGFVVRSYAITAEGQCPDCRCDIPGRWPTNSDERPGAGRMPFFTRRPRVIS